MTTFNMTYGELCDLKRLAEATMCNYPAANVFYGGTHFHARSGPTKHGHTPDIEITVVEE